MNKDKVIEKIKKLLALSKSSNINEAALAASTAQRLMSKYNIDAYILSEEKDDPVIDFTQLGEPLDYFSNKVEIWKIKLATVIAKCNHCKIYLNKAENGESCFGLVGRSHDAQTTRYLYHFLVKEIDRLTDRDGFNKKEQWRKIFRLGAVVEIDKRFKAIPQEVYVDTVIEKGFQKTNSAISKMNQRLIDVESWMDKNLNLNPGGKREVHINGNDVEAAIAGRLAAREINLGKDNKKLEENSSPTHSLND